MRLIDELIQEARARGQDPTLADLLQAAEARGKIDTLFEVLKARRLAMTETERSRILACTDAPTLSRWIARSATAATTAEILAEAV